MSRDESSSKQESNRREDSGRFAKGYSGNPGGRPRVVHEIQDLARTYSFEALERLVVILRSGKPIEQINAAKIILERAWGRPCSGDEMKSSEEVPFVPVINVVIREREDAPSKNLPYPATFTL